MQRSRPPLAAVRIWLPIRWPARWQSPAHIGKGQKQAAYMLERGLLPAFKIGNIWHMRRSTYAAFIAKLETAAIARATEATMT
jgi:hypothetical protein